ncbi:MAG: hypothetical protein CMP22_04880 [Rickettsiales bacterium]|nr:hypothetical protein [Rickettsiales bacterium]|tara:strand:+ start:1201 stop:4749 length:3549 start_codon:yes stop_codon:yes gene_type:complete
MASQPHKQTRRVSFKNILLASSFLMAVGLGLNTAHAEVLTSNAEVFAGASGDELTFVDDNPTNATFDAGAETISTAGATNVTFTGDTDTVITVDSDGALLIETDVSSDLTSAGANRQGVVDVTVGGANTTITVQAGTSVSATGTVATEDADATHSAYVVRDGATASLVNDGTISSTTSSAIFVDNPASADITNSATGVISGATTSSAITFTAANGNTPSGSVVNSGSITGGTSAIEYILNGDPSTESMIHTGDITNNAGATISASSGPALFIGDRVTVTGDITNAGTVTTDVTGGAVSLIQGTLAGAYDFSASENTSASTHIVTGQIQGATTLSTTQSDTIILSGTGARLGDIIGDATQTHTIWARDLTAVENNGTAATLGTVFLGNDNAGDNNSTISNISVLNIDGGTVTIDIDVSAFQVDTIDIASGAVLDNDSFANLDVDTLNLSGGVVGDMNFSNDTTVNVLQGAQIASNLTGSGATDVINFDLNTNQTLSLGGNVNNFETVNINSGMINTGFSRIEFSDVVTIAQGATLNISSANSYQSDLTVVNGTWVTAISSTVSGTVDLNSTGVISGNFSMDGQAGTQILNLNGGLITGAVDLDGSGNDVVNVNSNYTTQSTFSNVDDIIVNNGGIFTINVDHGIGQDLVDFTINNGGRLVIDANVDNTTSNGVLTNNGRLDVYNGHILSMNTQAAGTGEYRFQVESGGDAGSYGQIVLTGGGATLDGSNVVIEVLGANLNDGDEMLVFSGNGIAATITNGAQVTDNSFLYTFELVDGSASTDADLTGTDNTDILVRATAETIQNATSASPTADKNTAAVARFIDRQDFTTTTEFQNYADSLSTASTLAELTTLVNLAAPTMDGGDVYNLIDVADQTIDNSLQRLDTLRSGEYKGYLTGMSAGNRMTNYGKVWGQFFGTKLEQENRDNISGYESTSYGFTFGIDTGNSFDDGVVGASVSYADTKVKTDNANRTERDIDTLQMNLYGEYYLDDYVYLDGLIGVGINTIDQARYNVGGTGDVTTATYDAIQYTARAGLGFAFEDGGWGWQPKIYTRYTGLDAESYQESGTLALDMNPEYHQVLDVGLSSEFSYHHEFRYGDVIKPRVKLGVEYDVIGNPIEAEVGFVGSPGAFYTVGADPAKLNYYVGTGLTYFTVESWDFSADYVGSFRSEQTAHSGILKLTYNF